MSFKMSLVISKRDIAGSTLMESAVPSHADVGGLQCAKHKIGISAGPSPLCSTPYQIFLGRKVGISGNISTNFLLW